MKTALKTGVVALLLSVYSLAGLAAAAGKHNGEVPGIEVKALFSKNFGSTITDESGTYFNINSNSYVAYLYKEWFGIADYDPWQGYQLWSTVYEPTVYVEKYQYGSRSFQFTPQTTVDDVLNNPDAGVPLYFFDMPAGITIAITNNGPKDKIKVRVTTEAFVLNPDGSNGSSFGHQKVQDVEVLRGETALVDASFVAEYRPELNSGLDRLSIRISHPNNSNQENAGAIASYEAIFCPPEYQKNVPVSLSDTVVF